MLHCSKLMPQGRGLARVLIQRASTITLDWDMRQKSRFDTTDSHGRNLGIFLPRGTVVRGGDVLVADTVGHKVQRAASGTGALTIIAGTGTQGFSGDGGLAAAAPRCDPGVIAALCDVGAAVSDADGAAAAAVADADERERTFQTMVDRMYKIGKAVNVASHFEIDDVVDPADTRRWISAILEAMPAPVPRQGKKRPNIDTW